MLDNWIADLPQQFQGKQYIEALISAFSKQMGELQEVFTELGVKTDLEGATGKNLDMVGDIVSLTRKEARLMAGVRVDEPVISDDRYRQFIKYKVLKNTNDCTYNDIMQSIEILWDVSRARYYEKPDRPATIFIGLPPVGVDAEDQAKGKPAILKPAGVGFFYTSQYVTVVDHSALEKICFTSLDVHVFFRFLNTRLLDGNWLLDGTVSLGQIPIWGIGLGVTVRTIEANNDFHSLLETVYMLYELTENLDRYVCNMKMGITLNSCLETIGADSVNILFLIQANEIIKDDTVIVRKDLWHLDGRYTMDGSRIMDAEIREERL